MITSSFVFAACQPGAERALKQELARERPALRFAFSRPGLVTFRSPEPVGPTVALGSVFARAWGASLGPAATPAEILAAARALGQAPLRLHVFPRDPGTPVPELAPALHAAGGALFAGGDDARPGELVLDVVAAPGEPSLAGCHVHDRARTPYPGGFIPVDVPVDAPSRAYRKIEEAIAWSGARPRRGDVALEIGSAPGGAAYALARRGVSVVGVDPGAMDPRVLAFEGPGGARVTHVPVAVGGFQRDQLPARVDWLLVDVNLAPQVALRQIQRLIPPLRKTLRGAFLTLKMNDLRTTAEIPALLARVASMKLTPRATQLPSNRQEICVYAVPAG